MADLNFLNIDTTCTGIEVETPTTGKTYLGYIVGVNTKDFSSIKSYKIKWSANCCLETEYILPVPYALELNISSGCVEGSGILTIPVPILGIDKNLITSTSLSYNIDGGIYTSVILTNDTTPTVNIVVPIPGSLPTTYSINIKFTNLDGFEYIINEQLTVGSDGITPCSLSVPGGNVVTYPDPNEDENIDIDLGTGHLNFNTLIGSDPSLGGVYQVIVCEETLTTQTCVQNHVFLDCGIKCDVINKLVQCKDSDIMFFYDALTYGNDCTTNITYAELCSIYELMLYKITSDNCYSPFDNCNCNGTTTVFPTRNNGSVTSVRNCGSCTGGCGS